MALVPLATKGNYFLSAVPWQVPAGVTNLAVHRLNVVREKCDPEHR